MAGMTLKLATIYNLLKQQSRVIFIFLSICLGILFPQFKVFSPLIQPFLMIMLFYSFLNFDLKNMRFSSHLIWLTIANILIGVVSYALFSVFGKNNGLAAFVVGIAPTAISSTVIAGLIGGNVGYISAAIVLTNFSVALAIPFLLPRFLSGQNTISTLSIITPVFSTLLWPFLFSRFAYLLPSTIKQKIDKTSSLTYPLWYLTLMIVIAKASDFIFHGQSATVGEILQIAGISLLVCIFNFSVGAIIGGKNYGLEIRQALGHKNTTFVIWIALEYINPLVALSPTFYILFHNIINSIFLVRQNRSNNQRPFENEV